MIAKLKVVRAEWWLKKVRRMRCLARECLDEGCDPHHLCRLRNRDDFAVPLCRRHHRQLHDTGEWLWQKVTDTDLLSYLLETLIPMFDSESVARGKDS